MPIDGWNITIGLLFCCLSNDYIVLLFNGWLGLVNRTFFILNTSHFIIKTK